MVLLARSGEWRSLWRCVQSVYDFLSAGDKMVVRVIRFDVFVVVEVEILFDDLVSMDRSCYQDFIAVLLCPLCLMSTLEPGHRV